MTANTPPPAPGRLITFVGGDGAGKSTLAARLHQALAGAGHRTVLVSKHTTDVPADPELSAYLSRLNELVYRRDARVARECGEHYWLLALAAWYSLQDRHVIRPALASGTHVVLDNAHHKIVARYAVSPTVPAGLAEQVFSHLAEPDLLLFLDVSAREALSRKVTFTSLESGHRGGGDEDFICYQDTVLEQMRKQSSGSACVRLSVGGLDRNEVFSAAAAELADRLNLHV
ncbi:dTMP kinase [Streptomyces sp. NPDC093249]|uniref:dTMP kinase n=1 Tax=unclassified Streptomyces TaxID=2593676 RepID=UPI00344FC7E1